MALRTVQVGDFPSVPREILWYQRPPRGCSLRGGDVEHLCIRAAGAAAEAAAAAAKAATASAPKAKAAPAAPAPVAAPVVGAPVAPEQVAPAAEDAPVAALHILRVLLAVRMNKRARKPWT
ncbi:hypothetical protein PHYSODRAFT_324167 [Phytophthora sojae]|uniref:Uncharacterized protein n=1 Tax=Phytophthora sojae (strain P6497) TaxID=1094619 RepID=G4YRD7_PHYSP|nr:hypothetical protein PHYSODRAFT_324167 [Phytophthora sojae]EGZ22871.1 hypothetical protein PHYSODRAFT_324167 [Phytophthora sojae]|eukprot:XP_009518159.1 hypothetical protein PHYSODRAFT_324167 [Phytophthora sojae]